jgi:UDP-galactopyranose mutase
VNVSSQRQVVVIGGGVTGLSAGIELGDACVVLESEPRPGGCLRSDHVGGYTVDRTGHLFHMQRPWALGLLERGGLTDWVDHERDARVHVQGRTVPYPIQYNLAGLPPDVVARCLLGLSTAKPASGVGRPFSEWARSSFGDGLWSLFFEPYNRKLWQFDLDEMTADWTGRFVPRPDLQRAVEGALTPRTRDASGYNAAFSYPASGGSQSIPDALARLVPDLRYECRVVAVDWRNRIVTTDGGQEIPYSSLVSTAPITELIAMLEPQIPELDDIALGLHHNSIGYVAFAGPTPPPDWHWIYTADASVRPFRVGNLGSYARDLAPAGHSLMCVEQAFADSDVCRVPDQELISDAEGVLADLGLPVGDDSLRPMHVGRLSPAYVVFTRDTRRSVRDARRLLMQRGIVSTGRYGAWTYGSAVDAMRQGRAAGRLLKPRMSA